MIKKIPFGNTGHQSTRTIFGAAAFYNVSQSEADRTMDMITEYGINHIDTAASYGESEKRLGPWLKRNRKLVFLNTKTEKRTYKEAKEELFRSLERLCVDSIDLWQMHLLVTQYDWETAMNPGGALEAFIEAREQHLVRFLGVTGHGIEAAAMHVKSLDYFQFDTVLLPYNFTIMQHPAYAHDFNTLIQRCEEKKIAVQTIKSICRGPKDKGEADHYATWYTPLTKQEDIDIAVHWALSKEIIFINTVADITILPKVLDAAARFKEKISDDQMESAAKQMNLKPLFM